MKDYFFDNYKDNLAYDFEMFEIEKNDVIEIPKKANKSSVVSSKVRQYALIATVVIAAIAFSVMSLSLDVMTHEVTAQINATDTQIERLKSEEARLNYELEKHISHNNLEKEAELRGMKKASSVQMRYVDLNKGDSAQVLDNENVFEKILSFF